MSGRMLPDGLPFAIPTTTCFTTDVVIVPIATLMPPSHAWVGLAATPDDVILCTCHVYVMYRIQTTITITITSKAEAEQRQSNKGGGTEEPERGRTDPLRVNHSSPFIHSCLELTPLV